MKEKIFRLMFWLGILLVIAFTFVPIKGDLHKETLDIVSFKFHLDQVLHVAVYFLICIYFLSGQYFGLILFNGNSITKFLVLILILAICTELIQIVVPYRSFNFFDLITNGVGVGVGLVVIWLFGKREKEAVSK